MEWPVTMTTLGAPWFCGSQQTTGAGRPLTLLMEERVRGSRNGSPRTAPFSDRAEGGRACRSACEAFGSPEYCCNGAYGNPDTCHPSQYAQLFKSACPKSYSYAYDDASSTFTCNHTDYTITFCPKSTPSGGNSDKKIRRPSHEQLEDDVWLASLKKSSDAGAPTAASWSSTAFQSALAIAVAISLAVFDHPQLNLL